MQAIVDAPRLGAAQIAAFADHAGAHIGAVHADRIIGRIAHIGMGLMRGLHIGADAAKPEQIDRGLQNRGHQAVGVDAFALQPQGLTDFGGKGYRLLGAGEYPAALRNQALVVIVPARPGQGEEAIAFLPRLFRVGRGVEENMPVVKGRHQPGRTRQQHPIAEHIARHIAHAHHADRIGLNIHAHFAEMALDRNPCPARGDAHRLVVIALRPAAGEGIVQPEVLFRRQRIGRVGESRSALVGGDHEIGVLPIEHHHARRMHHRAIDDIVGEREQRADEELVAFAPFIGPCVAVLCGVGQLLGIETALGPGGHDHGVFDALRLHQAQHLGAEIVAPVGPAQAPARHRPGAQVDALDAG